MLNHIEFFEISKKKVIFGSVIVLGTQKNYTNFFPTKTQKSGLYSPLVILYEHLNDVIKWDSDDIMKIH